MHPHNSMDFGIHGFCKTPGTYPNVVSKMDQNFAYFPKSIDAVSLYGLFNSLHSSDGTLGTIGFLILLF